MANRIKGITIDIDGNTTKLSESLAKVNKDLKSTESELKDVNKLLKLDPSNTELLSQKQKLLKDAVTQTTDKLTQEKEALKQLQTGKQTEETIKQQNALKREIEATTISLNKYKSELKEVSPNLKKISDTMGELSEKTMALSIASGTALASLGGLGIKSAKFADELNTTAKQTGFTTEELQKMKYASELVDVSYENMTGSISKLTKQMASGASIFDTLGISITDSSGNMRDANSVWYESLEALSKVENETLRDQYAMELFGKSASSLSGIIDDGGKGLQIYGQEAENLGLILGQDVLDNANALNDELDKTKARLEATFLQVGAQVAETMLPIIEELAEKLSGILQWIASLDEGTIKLVGTILLVGTAISPILKISQGVLGLIQTISTSISLLSTASIPSLVASSGTAIAGITASLSGLLPIILAVASAIGVVAVALDALNRKKNNDAWESYRDQTKNMTQISSQQAQNWMNSNEVQAIKMVDGSTGYFVNNSDYSYNKANASRNGWTDDAIWGDNARVNYNMNVNVQQIDDLNDLIQIADQAQLLNRMGGY